MVLGSFDQPCEKIRRGEYVIMSKLSIMKNVTRSFNKVGFQLKKHSPEILTGIGIAGMITTTFLAVRATPKALELIEEKKDELNNKQVEERWLAKHLLKLAIF